MAGRHRLIVAGITLGKSRGDALKKELAQMNQKPSNYEALVPAVLKKRKQK